MWAKEVRARRQKMIESGFAEDFKWFLEWMKENREEPVQREEKDFFETLFGS